MNRLDEIKQRVERATPGEWSMREPTAEAWKKRNRASIYGEPYPVYYQTGKRKGELKRMQDVPIAVDCLGIGACFIEDAELIVNAPSDIRWLVGEVERMREMLRPLEFGSMGACRFCTGYYGHDADCEWVKAMEDTQ